MSAYGLLAEVSNGGRSPAGSRSTGVRHRARRRLSQPRSVFAGRSRRTLVAVCGRADPV